MRDNIFQCPLSEALKLKKHTSDKLKKLGVSTVGDLVLHMPKALLRKVVNPDLHALGGGECVVIDATIIGAQGRSASGKRLFKASNKQGQFFDIVFFNFNAKNLSRFFCEGNKLTIQGRVKRVVGQVQIMHLEVVFSRSTIRLLEPVYSLTQGISNLQLFQYILRILEIIPEFSSWHPVASGCLGLRKVLCQIHAPNSLQEHINAKKRLALEELVLNQFMMNKLRAQNRSIKKVVADDGNLHEIVFQNLGFAPNVEQKKALSEITKDQLSSYNMVRLLQGEVGSGKTLVALLSILNTVGHGKQAALMSPTDLLASQHYIFFMKALENSGINVALLTSKTKAKARRAILENLERGDIDILIGTHSLIQEKVQFSNLIYSVIDEQHKFGVKQRAELLSKNGQTDLLLMTATPIPRSLSLVLYGDMDVSVIRSKAKATAPIVTTTAPMFREKEVIESLSRIIDKGQKIYWVCPLIQDSEGSDLSSAISRYEQIKMVYGDKVSLLHGAMRSEEKDEVMLSFKDGRSSILVATTVVEVGIDVHDATLIVIDEAQSFGLAQLHQLRGRVGRGDLQSYCVLLYRNKLLSQKAKERLLIMTQSQNGFEIAKKDLELRGGGDLVGLKQSGEGEFRVANLAEDMDLLGLFETITLPSSLSPCKNVLALFDKHKVHIS